MRRLKICVGDFRATPEDREAVLRVLDSGRISEHKITLEFEDAFAKYLGARHSVAVNSGTSAIVAILTALKIDPRYPKARNGAKVITSPLTYVATANAIAVSGFEPVFVDVDRDRFGILPELVERAVVEEGAETIAAVLPVHLMGYPCDMDSTRRIAEEHDVVVIEDSAEAHGSLYKGRKTGTLSLASAFSFYVAHNLQAGEMGAVVTDDAELACLVRQIKANGRTCVCRVCTRQSGTCPKGFRGESDEDSDPRFDHEIVGYNFKVTEFQPSLALVQLAKADGIREKRLENFRQLRAGLEDLQDFLSLPVLDPDVSYLAFPIVLRKEVGINRRGLRSRLEEMGIETRPLFGCIPAQQRSFRHLAARYDGRLPNAERAGRWGFYVGCHQYLEAEDMDYVSKAFHQILHAD